TSTSWITPAAVDGTSIVALSDSSEQIGSSSLIVSPTLTNSSITGTSLKSPMSGTLTSTTPPLAAGAAAAATGAAAGAAAATGAAAAATPPASTTTSTTPSETLSPS